MDQGFIAGHTQWEGAKLGGLAHLLPGYRSVLDPQHRAEVAPLWQIPVEHRSTTPGYTVVELFHALAKGSEITRGLVSCIGIEFCDLAVIETKQRA